MLKRVAQGVQTEDGAISTHASIDIAAGDREPGKSHIGTKREQKAKGKKYS